MKRREQVRDFSKAMRSLAVTALLAVFIMVSAIPSFAATYQDGTYSVPVSLSKGRMSHNAIVSPCTVTVSGGQLYATLVFKRTSNNGTPKYTYLSTGLGTVYPQQYGPHAQIFYNVPISGLGNIPVKMETSAMDNLYVIDYTIYFDESAIPIVGGGSSGTSESSVPAANNSNGSHSEASGNKASEKKAEEKKEGKAKESDKDGKESKGGDKTKGLKSGDKAKNDSKKDNQNKKTTKANVEAKKNSKLPLYVGGLVVSLAVAGVGVFMLLRGRKIK